MIYLECVCGGRGVFADVTKLRVSRASWIIQVGLILSARIPYEVHTEEWSGMATSQGTPGTTRGSKNMEVFLSRVFRRTSALLRP